MKAAPAPAANTPAAVIPPDVPAGTRFPEMMERGSPPTSVPTSVDQVSAAEAANAPTPIADQIASGQIRLPRAATVNTPPFARTCNASRLPLFATIESTRRAFRSEPSLESAVAVRKKATSRIPQLHPAATAMVPEMVLAIAPLCDRDRTRCAEMETTAETAAPISARKSDSDSTDDPCGIEPEPPVAVSQA